MAIKYGFASIPGLYFLNLGCFCFNSLKEMRWKRMDGQVYQRHKEAIHHPSLFHFMFVCFSHPILSLGVHHPTLFHFLFVFFVVFLHPFHFFHWEWAGVPAQGGNPSISPLCSKQGLQLCEKQDPAPFFFFTHLRHHLQIDEDQDCHAGQNRSNHLEIKIYSKTVKY